MYIKKYIKSTRCTKSKVRLVTQGFEDNICDITKDSYICSKDTL